jgi:VIT1/CCC1 family predicted Fe2+/Mn2+ transporter
MAKDALAAHARDELGLVDMHAARPLQAAAASAATFVSGAVVPLLATAVGRPSVIVVSVVSLLCLVGLGAVAARAGGASARTGAARVGFWGALAMAATAGIGRLFGTVAG